MSNNMIQEQKKVESQTTNTLKLYTQYVYKIKKLNIGEDNSFKLMLLKRLNTS